MLKIRLKVIKSFGKHGEKKGAKRIKSNKKRIMWKKSNQAIQFLRCKANGLRR